VVVKGVLVQAPIMLPDMDSLNGHSRLILKIWKSKPYVRHSHFRVK